MMAGTNPCWMPNDINPRPSLYPGAGSSVMSNTYPSGMTRSILQPNMVNVNMSGTSGFRSPSIPIHAASQLNCTWTQPVLSPAQVPFPTSTASLAYQLPAPLGYSDNCSINISCPPAPVVVQSCPIITQDVQPSAGQNGFTSPWTCPKAWDELTNGTGTISSPVKSTEYTKSRPMSPSRKSHCKRKFTYDSYAIDVDRVQKVFIDEDRMATHMQELNLDNNNLTWHPDLEERPWFSHQQNNNNIELSDTPEEEEMTDLEDEDGHLPKLRLSNEVKLALKSKDLLPKPLLEELTKSSMQLILWKPPGDFVKDLLPPKPEDSSQATIDAGSTDTMAMSEECRSQRNPNEMFMLPAIPKTLPTCNNYCYSADSSQTFDDDMDL